MNEAEEFATETQRLKSFCWDLMLLMQKHGITFDFAENNYAVNLYPENPPKIYFTFYDEWRVNDIANYANVTQEKADKELKELYGN